jgi:predicted transcriptional regulator of viral defense system
VKASWAYSRLLASGQVMVRTNEVASVFGASNSAASQLLRRLVADGLIKKVRHGLFWIKQAPVDPWVALLWIAGPYPAYASLYSALYLHGVLSQIPARHYAVTVGRTQQVKSTVGTFSLHQLTPELFGGFETLPTGAKVATTEKALFDLAYLASTRSRLFVRPPELELPRRLKRTELERWIARIADPRRRKTVVAQLRTFGLKMRPMV